MVNIYDWLGNSEEREEVIASFPLRAMAATLDYDDLELDSVPPGWHWLYFLPIHRCREAGRDGHAQRGGFLPPVPLPRRMWAGGRLTFPHPLAVGQRARKRSTIQQVKEKTGRTGALAFVTVRHEIYDSCDTLCITEEHDIVYREDPKPGATVTPSSAPPDDAAWEQTIHPDPVLLFRYSALTFNGHRIHYDVDYCRELEGYPSLVFHGPLTATLLMEMLRKQVARPLARFEFQALSPLFVNADFRIQGRMLDANQAQAWALSPDGSLAMRAIAEF